MNYQLLQVPREKSELRCAIAAQERPAQSDTETDAIARVLETCDVVVDPRDKSVAKYMLEFGFWEWWVSKAMADCMRPGTICVDLGANAGYFAALFQSLGAAAVISVEANPELARRLRLTGERNHWEHFEVVECAVGDHEGMARLLVQGEENLGGSCIVPQDYQHDGILEVPLRTLDQLLGDLAPIQVLKMDCEGSEPAIWRGMQGVLANNPQMHVFAEVTVNSEAEPWLREVAAAGYTIRYCEYDGTTPLLDLDKLSERQLWMAYFHREDQATVRRPALDAQVPESAVRSGSEAVLHFAMLTYGGLEETKRAVRTIAATTEQPFVLHIVDNASPDGRTQAWLQEQREPWLRYKLNASNRGVPGGRNDLLDFILPQAQPQDWIVFVDNDLEFEAGWLQPFTEAMQNFPSARVLGKVGHLITVQETGRELLPAPARTGHVDVVSGGFACFVRADAAQRIGRFDEELGQFWHEDDDYCVRAVASGFDVIAVPESKILHHEHGSGVATPDLVNGGSRENLAFLADKWRAAGYLDSEGWVKRETGPYLPEPQRAEIRRRLGRPVGRSELAAAMTLLEEAVEQPDPMRWFDAKRHPIPACTWTLLTRQREEALQVGDAALAHKLSDLGDALQRASNTQLLREMTKATPQRDATVPGQGVCRDADFESQEFQDAARALGVSGLAQDPYARSAHLWELLALGSQLTRHGIPRQGARVLHFGDDLDRIAPWLEAQGVAIEGEPSCGRGRYDCVLFKGLIDTDLIVETLARHADEDTLVLVLGRTVLNGVPTRQMPQPLQLKLDLIERTRLRPTVPLALAVDDAVLEACVTSPEIEQYPALSRISGPQIYTSFLFAARWQPKPKSERILSVPSRAPATLNIGVDLRTLFYADSTARGIGKYTTQHLAALCEAEPGLRIAGYVTQDDAVLPPILQRPQISLQQIDSYRPEQVDLVHLPDPMNMSLGFDSPMRTLRHRCVTATFHDLTPLHYYIDQYPRANREGYLDRLRQLERSQVQLLTNSAFTAQDLLEHRSIPSHRVTPILAGLHRDAAPPPSAAEIAEVQREFGIRAPFVLHVGALDPHKNFYSALSAFFMARSKRPLQLLVVGAVDPGTSAAAAFCSKRKVSDVIFTGYLPRQHLNALYASATALLFLSRAEGFGLPILEAMAKGCPVIASNTSSHPEVAGDAALLVDPDDQAGAAAHLLQLLEQPELAQQLRERGMQQATKFTWQATALRTLAAWQQLLGQQPQQQAQQQAETLALR